MHLFIYSRKKAGVVKYSYSVHSIRDSPLKEFKWIILLAYFAWSGGTSLNHSRSMLPCSLTSRLRKSCMNFSVSDFDLNGLLSLVSTLTLKNYVPQSFYLDTLCKHVVHSPFFDGVGNLADVCRSYSFPVQ